uniref:insulin-like peptide INSL5 n=1 Tax=Jaculus jaculus TaxID=51337 RepID=UPI0003333071|nr:insulin-like peptide INSL5 [Jaculus jaculus]
MKASPFTLFLFSVLFAISEVRSKEIVKLCGLEYMRTAIYICASSRWRRQLEQLEESPHNEQAKRRNYFQLQNRHEASKENMVHNLHSMEFSRDEHIPNGQKALEGLWESKRHSMMSRQDLQTLCCMHGCSMTDLSALC